jgi:hypothetical protein
VNELALGIRKHGEETPRRTLRQEHAASAVAFVDLQSLGSEHILIRVMPADPQAILAQAALAADLSEATWGATEGVALRPARDRSVDAECARAAVVRGDLGEGAYRSAFSGITPSPAANAPVVLESARVLEADRDRAWAHHEGNVYGGVDRSRIRRVDVGIAPMRATAGRGEKDERDGDARRHVQSLSQPPERARGGT